MVPDTLLLQDSCPLFRVLIATAVDGIVVIDARGIIRICNPACERIFGYTSLEMLGRDIAMLMLPANDAEAPGTLVDCEGDGRKSIAGPGREVVGRRKDLSTFCMYLSVGEGLLDGQQICIAVIHDLTAIREEVTLRQASDRLLAHMVESSDDAIVSKTLEGIITSWNPAAKRIFGYSPAEIVGRNMSVLVPAERVEEEDDILRRLRGGSGIEHYETVRIHKNGSAISISLSVSPIRDSAGQIIGITKIARDITDKQHADMQMQRLQNELAHAARTSAMTQMTAVIAHEINQPLAAITNYLMATQALLKSDHPTLQQLQTGRAAMDSAIIQAARAASIIHSVREFARKGESEKRPEDINYIIRQSVALAFLGAADSGVKVRTALASGIPPLTIDKIQIEQVLINLIRNGIEAMASVKNRVLSLSSGRENGEFVFITVRDTGPGLAPDVAARLFKPFVTTKNNGLGIGLNICESIMESHGGSIHVIEDGLPGAGFHISLPLSRPVAGVGDTASSAAALAAD